LPLCDAGVTGTLPIGNGGTGQTIANDALNAFLPSQTGNGGKLLSTDGSNTSWASAASSTLTQYYTDIGNSSNTRTATNTNLLGNIAAITGSATVTITIASPGVVTLSSHGLSTGDKIYLTTTGALPTGLSASTTYYVINVSSSTFRLAVSLTSAHQGTAINTSGSQSGTHTAFYGGLKFLSTGIPGAIDGVTGTAGYVGEFASGTGSASPTSGQYGDAASLSLQPGIWDVVGRVRYIIGATTVISRLDYGISTASGNSATGLVSGENYAPTSSLPATSRETRSTAVRPPAREHICGNNVLP
jgi:hypothetical protein